MARAYYSASATQLIQDGPDSILGRLVARSPFEVTPAQRNAWIEEIKILRTLAVQFSDTHVYLEFSIPRMGRRADAVILWRGVVLVVEFKVGAELHSQHAVRAPQVPLKPLLQVILISADDKLLGRHPVDVVGRERAKRGEERG